MLLQRFCLPRVVNHHCVCHSIKRYRCVVSLLRCSVRLLSFGCNNNGYKPLSLQTYTALLCRRVFSSTTNDGDEYEQYRHLSQDVITLIQQENERTRQSIDETLKQQISQEILDAYDSAAEEAIPELGPTGQYFYYSNDSNGQRHYHRKHIATGKEQVVLDINFHEYQLHAMSLSVGEIYMAYLVSPVDSPTQTIVKIRHLNSTREIVLATNDETVSNIEWGPQQDDGSESLFFTTLNDKSRPFTVYACTVDSDERISTPERLYHSDDEAVIVDVQRTKGCQCVAIYASTKTSSEIYLVKNVKSNLILVRPREEGVLYHVDVGLEDDIFVLAQASEPKHESCLSEEMTLFETTVPSLPLRSTFGSEYLQEKGEYIIADMDVFNDFVALYERSAVDGRHRIRVRMRSEATHSGDTIVPLPCNSGDCAVLSSCGNMFYHSTSLRFHIESPCNPGRTYSYDTSTGGVQVLSGEAAASSYVEKRVFVTSKDGAQVPMSLVFSDDDDDSMSNNEKRPTVLIGYGAYGEPVCHGFDPAIVPLLNRGFVIAYAHTRGGGELGREWYRAGRLYEKERVIEDYMACAEALVESLGISEPRLLTGKGFSAGGVTIAGAVNRQPSLFGRVVLTNPFLDVTTAMTNTDLALTEHEWNEWGNVVKDERANIAVSWYCPMTNVVSQDYPKMLLVGTIDDENVPFWHPLTFCLKIRKAVEHYGTIAPKDADCTEQRVLVHIEPSGGHQMHGTKLDITATEAAFIVQCQDNDN